MSTCYVPNSVSGIMDTVATETKSYFHGGSILAREEDNAQMNDQENCYEAQKIGAMTTIKENLIERNQHV